MAVRVLADRIQADKTEEVDLAEGATGMDLLRRLGLSPDAHLLIRGETPIPVDAPLTEGERVIILSVVSGGA